VGKIFHIFLLQLIPILLKFKVKKFSKTLNFIAHDAEFSDGNDDSTARYATVRASTPFLHQAQANKLKIIGI